MTSDDAVTADFPLLFVLIRVIFTVFCFVMGLFCIHFGSKITKNSLNIQENIVKKTFSYHFYHAFYHCFLTFNSLEIRILIYLVIEVIEENEKL